ncbi:hypothetical protein [Aegicerativicinus sediminis]|uniref:hypothetical protein n=1 Tax=Aegicerativicinus sediminis TaxID=2893202 RepID=UPI001E61E043|nr:hypothetical protein [Aegicerativicinus sediminis]
MKRLLILSMLTLFIYGCSETEPIDNQNPDASLQFSTAVKKLMDNKDFNDFVIQKNSEYALRTSGGNSNSNGVMVIEMEGGIIYGFGTGRGFVFFGSEKASTKILPNGLAQLKANTSDPFCFIFDFMEGGYSNGCYEDPQGHFTINLTGELLIDEAPWGTYYFVIPPYKTASVFKATNIKLSDENTFYDEETGMEYCLGDATVEKTLNFKLVDKANNNGNGSGSDFLWDLDLK